MSTIEIFGSEVAKAMSIAMTKPDELPGAIQSVDQLYTALVQDGEEEAVKKKVKEEILVQLRQHPQLFARFNFASSLVSEPQSPFYAAVAEACHEELPNLGPKEMTVVIESCRRNARYEEMGQAITALELKIGFDPQSQALRAKSFYEAHMAAYAASLSPSNASMKQLLLRSSKALAEMSAHYALLACDKPGELYAKMNITGLLLPALGQWFEAIQMSGHVCDEAEAIAALATDPDARKRVDRIAMSTYMHRITIGVENGWNKIDVQTWLERLQANQVFASAKDEEWAKKPVRLAEEYLAKK